MPNQAIVRLHTGEPERSSSQWVGALRAAEGLADAPWDALSVFQSGSALSVVARAPAASAWLGEAYPRLLAVALDALGRVARVELLSRDLGVRADTPYLWAYEIPRLVVAKKGEWAGWREPELAEPLAERLVGRINRDLSAQATAWGLAVDPPRMVVLDAGRPMPLKAALRADTNKAGTPLTVLARLGVRLASAARIEGDWFAGYLQGLGYGRIFRNGYVGRDELTERHLAALGVELDA